MKGRQKGGNKIERKSWKKWKERKKERKSSVGKMERKGKSRSSFRTKKLFKIIASLCRDMLMERG